MPSLDLDDTESLRRAYVDEGRSLSAIAEMAGCSYASVRRALLAQGIEIRRSGPAPIGDLRDKEWLQSRARDGWSVKDIARELGCAEGTVRSALQWAGVTARPSRDRPPGLDDAPFLERAYVTDRRSVRSIAEELGCTKDAVLGALRAHGVPIRRRGRAPKLVVAMLTAPDGELPGQPGSAHAREPALAPADGDKAGPEPDAGPAPGAAQPEPDDGPSVHDAGASGAQEEPEPEPAPEPELEPGARGTAVHAADMEDASLGGAILAPAGDASSRSIPDTPRTAHAPMQQENGAPVRPATPPPTVTENQRQRPLSAGRAASPPTSDAPPGRIDAEIDKIEQRTFSVTLRGYDRQEVHDFLRAVAADYRQTVMSAREAVSAARAAAQSAAPAPPVPVPPPAPRLAPSFEDIGDRVTAVLTSAAEAAEEIRVEAETEALAIRQRAREEGERLRRSAAEALAETERARAASQQEAAEAEAASRAQAEQLVAVAQERAAQMEADAQHRITTMDRTVRANIDAAIAEARRDYEHLRSAQQQCIDRLASVEFLAKHARDGLSDNAGQSIDELL